LFWAPERYWVDALLTLTHTHTLSDPLLLCDGTQGLAGTFFIVANVRLNRWRKQSFLATWPVSEVLGVVLLSCLLQYPMEMSRYVSICMCTYVRLRVFVFARAFLYILFA
jgi:hypothetical protein